MKLNEAAIREIRAIRVRSTISYSQAARVARVLDDCRNLSSGTLATLTGRRDYADLDVIHDDFVRYVQALGPRNHWSTWVEAWRAFEGNSKIETVRAAIDKAEGRV